MAASIMSVRRSLALALVGVHLVLTAAVVPHVHAPAAAGGAETARQPHHAHPPHRHWAWAGHCHHGHEHGHGSPSPGDRQARRADTPPHPPVDHDQSALYMADAFLVFEAGPLGLPMLLATGWITVPFLAGPGNAAASSRPLPFSRPPGDRLPAHHTRLPHVLRI